MKEKEDELADTKRDHAYDMQSQGYDALSDELNQMLEDTEYEISHNADKQNEIINNMLNKQVDMYKEAYAKINSIISNYGWVGSTDFNNNQEQMSSQAGAQGQKDNASQSQSNANKNPSSAASGTITSGIKDNSSENNKITEDIMKPENTTNRLCAELKVDKTSVSLEEGKSATITVTIRPNDAKNKSLSWGTSNSSIATVSNGTISAKKPGSCQVIVATTDGSGLTQTIAVTVTKKPEPPKPAPTPANNGGDGIPRVGDVVTYSGSYYYDSWGQRPAGNLYSGVPKGVVIDDYSAAEYGGKASYTGGLKVHIKSADGTYGNLGWVSLDQISGYKDGTNYVSEDQVAKLEEEGRELVLPDGTKVRKIRQGAGVIPHTPTEKLLAWSNNLDSNGNVINGELYKTYNDAYAAMTTNVVDGMLSNMKLANSGNNGGNVTIEYNNPVTFNSVDKSDIPAMKDFLKESYKYTVKELSKDFKKGGMRVTR